MDALRDDLEAALATVDTELSDKVEDVTPEETPEVTHEATPEDTSEDTPDVSADGDSDVSESPETPPLQGGTEAKPPSSKNSMKAPLNWSPKAREDWSRIPRHLQEVITTREKEVASTIANTKAARQTHEHVNRLAQTYAPVMAAEGVNDPIHAIEGLFNTVARLRMGSPKDKASMIADMINAYGVDVNEVDSALAGYPTTNAGQSPAANPDIERLLEERLAPVNKLMQSITSLQSQQAQATQQQAAAAVEDFATKAEFLQDVRADMADLIDMAAARGHKMTLQEAYDKACAINPDIQAVMSQRSQQNSYQAKRNAASSIRGNSAGVGGGGGTASIRDAIAAAWDDNLR